MVWPAVITIIVGTIIFVVWSAPTMILDHDLGDRAHALPVADLAQAKNGVRTTLLQALAGAILVSGVLVGWRQLKLSQNAHLVQTFTQAVERLNSSDKQVRSGGIFALGLTASPISRVRIVAETLCSWVRDYETPQPKDEDVEAVRSRLRSRAPDLQSAMEVLMTLKLPRGDYLRLSGVDLRRATLRNARLAGADLRNAKLDASDLRGADLRRAHLDGASLVEVDLVWADLRRVKYSATTDWRGAKIDAGSEKLPKDLDPEAAGMVQQELHEIPPGFQEPRGPNAASFGKFGG